MTTIPTTTIPTTTVPITPKPSPYEDLIRITDLNTESIATVSIVVRQFPNKLETSDIKVLLTHFLEIFTQALLISQRNNINQFDVLIDCEGTTTSNIDYTFGKNFVSLMKKSFDNNLGRCVIFNANTLFKHVYSVFKKFIDKPTREKIKIFTKTRTSQKY